MVDFARAGRWITLNFDLIDDVTKECLAAVPDTSIAGRRVVREPGIRCNGSVFFITRPFYTRPAIDPRYFLHKHHSA